MYVGDPPTPLGTPAADRPNPALPPFRTPKTSRTRLRVNIGTGRPPRMAAALEGNVGACDSNAVWSSSTDSCRLSQGCTVVLSGFMNPLRGKLRKTATDLGAKYQDDWEDSVCTHLIAAFENTPKVKQVKRGRTLHLNGCLLGTIGATPAPPRLRTVR